MKALQFYLQALRELAKYGILKYLIAPGILSLAIFSLLYLGANRISEPAERWLAGLYPFDFGKGSIEWITGYFSELVFLVILLFLLKYILFIVMAPFMSHLSERVEREYYPDAPDRPFSIGQAIKDMVRGLQM